MKLIKYSELGNCDLIVDAIYEGGSKGNTGDDPISKIFSVGNQGGFRYSGNVDNLGFVVLYTSGENKDWPDNINTETGVFKYYGDNKTPGQELHETSKKGNLILKNLFDSLYSNNKPRTNIPPIFVFEKYPTTNSNRSVQFKGLCVPGTEQNDSTNSLVAIWRTTNNQRFQNYLAHFTILDIAAISRLWINELNSNSTYSTSIPKVFSDWVRTGKYKPLVSTKTISIRTIEEQLPKTKLEWDLLKSIFDYFKESPTLFEGLAAEIYKMTNTSIIIDEITRGVVDGGRDAIGRLKLGLDSDPIYVDFALEAKCYNPGDSVTKANTVGVKETSRLISRIRNRQYGVLVTTSALTKQAYEEIRNDQHPIIIISGGDIVKILIEKGINNQYELNHYLVKNISLKV